jgi:hypothetical protein
LFIGTNNGSQTFICFMGADEYCRLISRAVAALEINIFEDRRAIYNRARAVQSYQLGKRPSGWTSQA